MRAVILVFLLLSSPLLRADLVRIATASNFKSTLIEINALFEARYGHKTLLSSASTGTLYNQIKYGAPFDVFFAADSASPLKLEQSGFGVAGQRFCYARGSLVLLGSKNSAADLANPRLSLAIANPNTAPYGRAALEVLHRPEFSGAASRKLVRANNAIQAYQHWHSSTVRLALVPLSLSAGQGTDIPPDWYTPIEQHVIALRRGQDNPAARAYLRWIRSEKVRALIDNAGYGACL